jgi:glutamate-ammonia-ligase adenylyltransferase
VTPSASAAGESDIVIVAFDYLSEFSIFCGALSAFGLDIRAGDVYSFSKGASPRKIVDVFRVRTRPEEPFDKAKQNEFEEVLLTLGKLLASGSINQAREQLNRFLIERIESMNEELSGLLSVIEIRFDNDACPDWTVMEARSEDAFAFLYTISNALAMQGVYIHKVKIRSSDHEAKDQFFIANKWGRKITGTAEKNRLTMAVAMIKQFTVFLPEAPDPAKALLHFDQLVDKIAQEEVPDRIVSFLARKEGMNMLAHLLGSSDFLWDEFLSVHFQDLIPTMAPRQ